MAMIQLSDKVKKICERNRCSQCPLDTQCEMSKNVVTHEELNKWTEEINKYAETLDKDKKYIDKEK